MSDNPPQVTSSAVSLGEMPLLLVVRGVILRKLGQIRGRQSEEKRRKQLKEKKVRRGERDEVKRSDGKRDEVE